MADVVDDHNEATNRRAAQDLVLVACLSIGKSYDEAGETAGISGRTVARRMSDPEFARRVEALRAEHVAALTGQVLALGPEALQAIRDCLGADRPPVQRLRAASLALGYVVKFHHLHDLVSAVADIKRQLADRADNKEPPQ